MIQSFESIVADEFGMAAAVIFNHIGFWWDYNRRHKQNLHDGKYWTYDTIKTYHETFTYLSERQIRLAIQTLIDGKMIIKGCFNSDPHDRTTWYSLTEKGVTVWRNSHLKDAIRENACDVGVTSDVTSASHGSDRGVTCTYTDLNYTDLNTDIRTPKKTHEIETWGFSDQLSNAVRNWIAYKKEKRQSYKETGLKQLLTKIKKESEKHGDEAVIEVIESSMSSNYQGIVWDRIKDKKKSGSAYIDAINNRYDMVDEWLRKSGES